jgi:hypothetical protein
MKATDQTWFLRFYGVTPEKITACIEQMKADGAQIQHWSMGPLTGSVNSPLIAPKPHTEATLVFPTPEALEEFTSSRRHMETYLNTMDRVGRLGYVLEVVPPVKIN